MVGVLSSKPAMAATVTYDFTVDVYTGAYVGKYNGSFSYDDSTAPISCESGGAPTSCLTPTDNNLTVLFNFLGNTYTEKNERDSGYPRVFFPSATNLSLAEANGYGGLSFLVVSPQAPVGFFFLGYKFRIGNTEGADPYGLENDPVGNVSYTLRPPLPDPQPEPTPDPSPDNPPPDDDGATAVPEPSEIGGSALALSLLGIAWYWRRSKTAAIDPDQDR